MKRFVGFYSFMGEVCSYPFDKSNIPTFRFDDEIERGRLDHFLDSAGKADYFHTKRFVVVCVHGKRTTKPLWQYVSIEEENAVRDRKDQEKE